MYSILIRKYDVDGVDVQMRLRYYDSKGAKGLILEI
jgi:hypothetical protein